MRNFLTGLFSVIAIVFIMDVFGALDSVGGMGTFVEAAKTATSQSLSEFELPSGDNTAGKETGTGSSDKGDAGAEGPSLPKGVPGGSVKAYKQAQAHLEALEVKGKAPKTGYDRDQFGPAWKDVDKNGCDTRNDMLARDLVDLTYKNSGKCVIDTGVLEYEPYLGLSNVPFKRGDKTQGLDAEHVVALGNAWVSGAWQWDDVKRVKFANDPAHLIMVDPGENRSKGDKNAAEWLPKNKAFRCDYITIQVEVKHDYSMSVTQAEYDAMDKILDTCTSK